MNRVKFVFLITLSALFFAACATQEPAANHTAAEPTEPPFSNMEPEKYQTFIVQTTPSGPVRFLVARDGDNWRIDSAVGSPTQTGSMRVDKKDFVLAFAAKAYGEYTSGHGYDERPEMVKEITLGMLNGREPAVYEKVGSEGGLTRYRYTDAKGRESVITFDEEKGLPVKKEILTTDGEKRAETTITLEGFTTEVDPANFVLPQDFKKVSMDEMKKILIQPQS